MTRTKGAPDGSDRPARQGKPDSTAFFEAATGIRDRRGVRVSTMMGLPCLRLHGSFFASYDHRSGDLLVKLDRDEVDRMIDAGEGHPFSPAGRRFREWLAVPPDKGGEWPRLLTRAHAHAAARLGEPPSGS